MNTYLPTQPVARRRGRAWLVAGGLLGGLALGLFRPLVIVAVGGFGVVAGPSEIGLLFVACLAAFVLAGLAVLVIRELRSTGVMAATIVSAALMVGMIAGNVLASAARISWAAPGPEPTVAGPSGAGWSTTGSLTAARYEHTATLLADGRVLVAGGRGADERVLSSAEIYDPRTGTWTPTGSMLATLYLPSAILLNDGRVLVLGSDGQRAQAQVYDPRAGTWTSADPLSTPRTSYALTLLDDGRVLVTGGSDPSAKSASTDLYDPVSGLWTTGSPMGTARAQHSATLLADGRVLVAGGVGNESSLESNPMGLLTSAEIYDPATDAWRPTGDLVAAADRPAATRLADRSVLLAGAIDAAFQLYDPATERWHEAGASRNALAKRTTLLPDEPVLSVGILGDLEVWDPATGSVTERPSSNHGSGATATLLRDGRVLFAGGVVLSSPDGYGLHSTVLASADLYDPALAAP
jgi:Galactose oxidase, central domain